MKVIVDSTLWSLLFRRKEPMDPSEILIKLIHNSEAVMIGAVRQEVLSGLKSIERYLELKRQLETYEDFNVTTHDYETAAKFSNICKWHGVQGSNTDFLICAVAYNNGFSVLTHDNDFTYFSNYIPITLHI
jgi:predicted nucleic acid-binding protein